MKIITGHFDKQGNPCIEFELAGARSGTLPNLIGIIDTGFTGFVSLPLVESIRFALEFKGTLSATLADGSNIDRLTTLGEVTLRDDTREGLIILEPGSSDVLVGMDFLRTFSKGLWTGKSEVFLVDENWFDVFLANKNQLKLPDGIK